MNIVMVKENLKRHLGCDAKIKYSLGRNKYERYQVKIKKLYNNVFTVLKENNEIRSFSYNDVIMKTIKIDFL